MKRKLIFYIVKMQTLLVVAVVVSILFFIVFVYIRLVAQQPTTTEISGGDTKARLAIIIDDFGQSREGVEQMMSIDRKLTFAIMPRLQYSQRDSKNAADKKFEVIVHIPLQSSSQDNVQWVGPHVINVGYDEGKVRELMLSFFDDMPEAVGANFHMGVLGSANAQTMTYILRQLKEKDMFFVDSRTNSKSVCRQIAQELNVPFNENNVFLESGGNTKENVRKQLLKAANLALKRGSAVAIGHVGPQGGDNTAKAISEMIPELEKMGVELVYASEIVE